MGAAVAPIRTIEPPKHPRPARRVKSRKLFEPELVRVAMKQAVVMLRPDIQWANPVMFVVEIGAVMTTYAFIAGLAGGASDSSFVGQIALWLWFTVLFANFAEAIAEGRGGDLLEAPRRNPRAGSSQRIGLCLAVPFGDCLGEVREEHRNPQPNRYG